VEADITYDETRHFPYTFNVTAFDDITMQWMVVCRIRITRQTESAYSLCFQKMIEQCSKDQPSFKVGHTLLSVVVDWSDAQCKGLKVVVGQDLGEKLLHGCEVHWHRSFQRVREKICKQSNPEKRRIEKQAFHLAAAAITKVKTKDQIYKPFHCLCGKKSLSEVRSLIPGLQAHHIDVVKSGSDWSAAKHWVNWWTRPNHLRMLCGPFASMSKENFAACPRTTNAVECHNRQSKDTLPLDCGQAFTRLYRIDKAIVLRYIAASTNTQTLFLSNSSIIGRQNQS